ncbi:MAG TPA: PAS domain-containing protein, partial [Candidatus Dormibacteraeota bacterium]|nr:PAS domain-containing protein [Candidatus Dormibacteraeota bacterium]
MPDPHTIFAGGSRGTQDLRGEGLNITTPSPFVRFSAWRKGSTHRFRVVAAIAGVLLCAADFIVPAGRHTRGFSPSLNRPVLAGVSGRSAAGWVLAGGLLLAFACGGAGHSRRTARGPGPRAERTARSDEEPGQQKQMLQSILDSLSDGVVAANLQGEFILFNPAAEAIVGLGPGGKGPREWAERYGVYLPDATTPYPPAQLPLARAMRGESVDGDIQF